ncbi:hypothetical protein BGP_6321 [Beggiatoa sp. PS]|nr:hypothetical protein BGP_6321 [Beggiatoa sp. PS]
MSSITLITINETNIAVEIYRLINGQYMPCIGQPLFMPEIGLA